MYKTKANIKQMSNKPGMYFQEAEDTKKYCKSKETKIFSFLLQQYLTSFIHYHNRTELFSFYK